jgi:Met-zincin/Domain of unknown function (DUF5117)
MGFMGHWTRSIALFSSGLWLAVLLGGVSAIAIGAEVPRWLVPIGLPLAPSASVEFSRSDAAPRPPGAKDAKDGDKPDGAMAESSGATGSSFDRQIKGLKKLPGLFTLYRNSQGKLLAEIRPNQLDRNYLFVATLSAGVGEFGLYRGMPLDDFPFTLRRLNNRIQLVIPNLLFRSTLGTPQATAQNTALNSDSFSDSVVYTLPIVATNSDRKTMLVDLSGLILKEAPGIEALRPLLKLLSYQPNSEQSVLKSVKNFPLNAEIEANYQMNGGDGGFFFGLQSIPNRKSFNLGVRYSLSQLPAKESYKPRLADERIGYFLTAYRDVSGRDRPDPFVRYINRWQLEKKDPSLALSPPKQPIVLWIENSVPKQYRDSIREGILMWNVAFEQAGFKDAIEVRQMPDNADWDPADIRYNTIRWFKSIDGGLALGPSRTDPYTGQILDADILIDESMVRFSQEEYRTISSGNSGDSSEGMAALSGAGGQVPAALALGGCSDARTIAQGPEAQIAQALQPLQPRLDRLADQDRCYSQAAQTQFAIGQMSLSQRNALPSGPESQTYQRQYLSSLVAHEVGHILGLRHNFHGSTMLKPSELNDRQITDKQGLSGSVMDYLPVNLAPEGKAQGDYFTQHIGPYDTWAVAYGYTPIDSKTVEGERKGLAAIAKRSPEPGLAYATDEDMVGGRDPRVNAFDLSADPLVYNQQQMERARQLWDKLNKRGPGVGESYSTLRRQFSYVLGYYFRNAIPLTNYIGGRSFNRFKAGDAPGRTPLETIDVAQQRQALTALSNTVFTPKSLDVPPELLDKLPPSRWVHWGASPEVFNFDFPLYDRLLNFQTYVLSNLLSGDRLMRLRNAELQRQPNLTIAELLGTLQTNIWEQPLISGEIPGLRRGLQRQYLNILVNMTLRNTRAGDEATSMPDRIAAANTEGVPDEARILARYQLQQLRSKIAGSIGDKRWDLLTRAHLEESRDRITKTLDAGLRSQ